MRRILAVDDDPQLLRLLKVFLERSGYAVVASCANGEDAVREVRSDPAGIDVAVVDLTLPDIQGDQAALQMLALNPNLKILICSGYPYEVESLPAEHRGNFAHLQKPFLPKMLLDAVADLLAD